ncbi:helix-turn-helix domain-containing protein [Thermomonospora umbrina]|uniref:Helix-turn-helix protein n=1 Tax=Thermomonospora umbrina TaxID=111806 RepID=A0A3D9SM12_9ACTN|nr:helix-turn-helix transcriptional regulator [Thermomonospora umbrina]REE96959.1 helix-turn-helix protein [Thermomonospora umbrina]
MSTPRLGERLQAIRKRRGLTQRELAQLSGVSISLLRKLEQGEREDTRVETLRKLAMALRITTAELILRPEPEDEAPVDGDQWAPVRDALLGRRMPEPDEEPTIGGVKSALRAGVPLSTENRYADLGAAIPSLLRDADALGPDGRLVQARAYHLAGLLMVQTRQFDAADMALARAVDSAPDRLEAAAAINTRCWLLIRQGRLRETLDLAATWADDIEPKLSRATLAELATWGGLLVRVSAAAVRNNQPGEADDALRLAYAAGAAMGREYASPSDYARTFGPLKVAMMRAENAMVADRPDRVLAIAERIPERVFRPQSPSRKRHRLDVANAHVSLKRYTDAVDVLQELRSSAPEWIVNQRLARDILAKVISRRRTLTSEMRDLADFVSLEY